MKRLQTRFLFSTIAPNRIRTGVTWLRTMRPEPTRRWEPNFGKLINKFWQNKIITIN